MRTRSTPRSSMCTHWRIQGQKCYPQVELKIHQKGLKRHISHSCTTRLNMLPLYGLPSLPETRSKSLVYNVRLLIMYIIHIVGTAVSLPCYNPSTGKPSNHTGFICVCALPTKPLQPDHVSRIRLLHLPQSKPRAITSNLSYSAGAKMCLNTLSYLLHSGVGMSSHSCSAGYILGSVQGQSPKC